LKILENVALEEIFHHLSEYLMEDEGGNRVEVGIKGIFHSDFHMRRRQRLSL